MGTGPLFANFSGVGGATGAFRLPPFWSHGDVSLGAFLSRALNNFRLLNIKVDLHAALQHDQRMKNVWVV